MYSELDTYRTHKATWQSQEPPSSTDLVRLPRFTWYDPCKAIGEYVISLVLFVLAAPVILLAAAVIKLTSRGPAFYRQTRLGLNGRLYTIYKLRTMRHNCERQSGPCWAVACDPRITPIGGFLRRTHLDELPQLWNVLRGEMSLVGPRPERPEFIPQLEEALPFYRSRLLLRPGVTGLAQVQLPADTDLASVRRKLAYDLHYVRHRNPWLDLRVILATALYVVGMSYPAIRRVLSLPGFETVERGYLSLTTETGVLNQAEPEAAASEPAEMVDVEMVTCV